MPAGQPFPETNLNDILLDGLFEIAQCLSLEDCKDIALKTIGKYRVQKRAQEDKDGSIIRRPTH